MESQPHRHHGYLDMPSTPLFHFGHGLSYTTFVYSPLTLTEDTVDVGGDVKASLTVTNSGKRRGTELRSRATVTVTGKTRPIKGENRRFLSTAVSS